MARRVRPSFYRFVRDILDLSQERRGSSRRRENDLVERYDMGVFNEELCATLRRLDVNSLRQFAAKWGKIMGNRSLLNLVEASDEFVAIRMRMMILDRPDLADIHAEANQWLLLKRRPHLSDCEASVDDG